MCWGENKASKARLIQTFFIEVPSNEINRNGNSLGLKKVTKTEQIPCWKVTGYTTMEHLLL